MKTVAIIKYVFTLVGIGMLAGTIFFYQRTRSFVDGVETAEGTVVELNRSSSTYRPVVRFRDRRGEEIEFMSSTGSNPPSYSRGERVEVLYLPSRPDQAQINGFFSLWLGPLILGFLGVVFLLIGGGIMFLAGKGGRNEAYLKVHGTRIETDFQSVQLNTSMRINGRSPYRVLTQWRNPATSEMHVFQSDNIWWDPTEYVPKRVTVLIDRNNPKKYHVDLSFLPKLAD
jgi:hypothetical protein